MIKLISLSECVRTVIVSLFFINSNTSIKPNPGEAKGFAVVELFTSEGCSSSPPADETVIKLVKEFPENVYVLGFHVDYWNYIGWKDECSKAD